MAKRCLSHDDYTIGWICALPTPELTAARAMLDEVHESLPRADGDDNSYCLGKIGQHNVAIACLPAENTGNNSTASVSKDLLRTFKKVRLGLFVGIGGGAPFYNETSTDSDDEESAEETHIQPTRDIRLGDVVISLQSKDRQAIVQYDFGKYPPGGFVRSRITTMDKPPKVLLTAISNLQSKHQLNGHELVDHMSKMFRDYPNLPKKYFEYQGAHKDKLFVSSFHHSKEAKSCKECRGIDDVNLIKREPRGSSSPVLHYGTIGSANSVMKDPELRDRLAKDEGILCFEMEAAGLESFPCLVIRGICDYADSHKNKSWQPYAATTAAAYAKELLYSMPAHDVEQVKTIEIQAPVLEKNILRVEAAVQEQTKAAESRQLDEDGQKCLHSLKTSTYEAYKDINQQPVTGTCQWALRDPKYIKWNANDFNDLLWVTADPGCGKSVLARSLIDIELRKPNALRISKPRALCYFFFKDNELQDKLTSAICALLHQLFSAHHHLLEHAMPAWKRCGPSLVNEVSELWRILLAASRNLSSHDVVVVLDAMDECDAKDLKVLQRFLSEFFNDFSKVPGQTSVKFFVTSRPYQDIESAFSAADLPVPEIRLCGEEQNESIGQEINLVIEKRVSDLRKINESTKQMLRDYLFGMKQRTYLWLYLTFDAIERELKNNPWPEKPSIDSLHLPTTVYDAYEKILGRIRKEDRNRATTMLHIIAGARRPLKLSEMAIALGLALKPGTTSYHDIRMNEDHLRTLLRDNCGLFVFISHETVYLIHQTAKEFLHQTNIHGSYKCWNPCLKPTDSAEILTEICANYLLLDDFNWVVMDVEFFNQHIQETKGFEEEWDKFQYRSEVCHTSLISYFRGKAFLGYAAEHWPVHFRDCNSEILLRKVYHLYDVTRDRFQLWFPIYWLGVQKTRLFGKPVSHTYINESHLAAILGHSAVLRMVLEYDHNKINAEDVHGRTAMWWGLLFGREEVVELLIKEGAAINVVPKNCGSSLYVASGVGNISIVKLLLQGRAKINAQEEKSHNTLEVASYGGHEEIVRLLLQAGAEVNVESKDVGALYSASHNGHEGTVKLLLQAGANVNVERRYGGTALTIASSYGYEGIIKLLLQAGAKVNAAGGYDGTALMEASSNGHEGAVKLLLQAGAEVNAEGRRYIIALVAASTHGHEGIVKLLLQAGAEINAEAEVNAEDEYGFEEIFLGTALMAASSDGHEGTVKLLLQAGAEVNAKGTHHRTALTAASAHGHEGIAKLLLQAGADVDAQGGYFGNAVLAASSKGYEAILKLLIQAGAKVNAPGESGDLYESAQRKASQNGHDEIVKMLQDGAHLNHQGGKYGTAHEAASSETPEETVEPPRDDGAIIPIKRKRTS